MVLLNSSEQSVHKIFFKSQGPHCQVRTNKHSPISICRWPHLLQVGAVTKDLFAPILSLWQWHWQSPSFPAAGAASQCSHCQTAIQAKSCLLPSGSAAWPSAAVPCYKEFSFQFSQWYHDVTIRIVSRNKEDRGTLRAQHIDTEMHIQYFKYCMCISESASLLKLSREALSESDQLTLMTSSPQICWKTADASEYYLDLVTP